MSAHEKCQGGNEKGRRANLAARGFTGHDNIPAERSVRNSTPDTRVGSPLPSHRFNNACGAIKASRSRQHPIELRAARARRAGSGINCHRALFAADPEHRNFVPCVCMNATSRAQVRSINVMRALADAEPPRFASSAVRRRARIAKPCRHRVRTVARPRWLARSPVILYVPGRSAPSSVLTLM
jgi:hypothetical protein